MEEKWNELYAAAKSKLMPRTVSPFIEAGGVAAAVLTDRGNIYTGVCIDSTCSLGMCAERSAVANMITNGESRIVRLVCIEEDGSIVLPCGACRELLMQLDAQSGDMEILTDTDGGVTTLAQLIPEWWGRERFEQANNA